jgi:pyruvate/2-oxoglutarate dehydrogenase complex dihydrolipoamide acyltransferase (E2) component
MPTNIIMPQLGESVVDGTVGEWLKKVGDSVTEFESIVRVSTDKVDTEIPAPATGVLLEILVKEGDTVNAGVLLGIVGENHAIPAPQIAPTSQATPLHTPAPQTSIATSDMPHITPVVARMLAEHQLDAKQINGSGHNGRVTKKDVLAYLENGNNGAVVTPTQSDLPPWEQPGSGDLFKPTVEYSLQPKTAVTSMPTPAPKPEKSAPKSDPITVAPTQVKPVVAMPVATPISTIPHEVVPISAMRRSIAEHMLKSKQTSPHVTTVFEVDLTAVSAHRATHKASFAQQDTKLTFTPYFIMACVAGLREYPLLNARWTDEGIHLYKVAHIGIATALEDGLIVPVLHNAQDYNLMGIARHVNDLAERARTKQLRPDEVKNGTFTLTNHGVSGSLFATPIINQPQVAILGVGAIEKRVKVINDAIAIRPCAYLSLTFDHRLIDGATGDGFVSSVKHFLEHWQS